MRSNLFLFFFLTKVLSHLVNCPRSVRYLILYLLVQFCVRLFVTIWLKYRVPSKISTPSWFHYSPGRLPDEQLWLLQFRTHVGYYAHRKSSLILERLDHFSQTLRSNAFEEPFDVGSRQSIVGIIAKRSIFDEDWLFGFFEGDLNFIFGNFFRIALKFRDYE